jgi:hypothetical protein
VGYIVSDFAKNVLKPLVPEMEEKEQMPKQLIKDLFDYGVCKI